MFHIIVNPSSSSGRGKSKWDKVETRFKQSGVPYKVHFSSADNTIEKICGELTSRGEECSLVVLGGDGTMNAVVNGIQDFEHTRVGFIQTGSGNDLIKEGLKPDKDFSAILAHAHKLRLAGIPLEEQRKQTLGYLGALRKKAEKMGATIEYPEEKRFKIIMRIPFVR